MMRPFNRTSMELKLASSLRCGETSKTFNRTSMELKLAIPAAADFHCRTFNRTSMELKHYFQLCDRWYELSFNRTSMELKLIWASVFSIFRARLLIEPVWNWNSFAERAGGRLLISLLIEPVWNWNGHGVAWYWYSFSTTFNRTSMELKHLGLALCRRERHTFNRTSMELKLMPLMDTVEGLATFNRTSMELKHYYHCHTCQCETF